ncbi:FkbM family methyltransferase [Pseudomonas faucium]|uniref:FkbM family methyltransferase n=1 Tax=Pseudomonas faucium TaxID=2740518 RepID=UPI001596CCAC|nr:FkbM family methyltransferase [Pseudomonas faucium]
MAEPRYHFADFIALREQAARLPSVHLEPGQVVWVFGAGNFGRSLATAMQKQGVVVAGFVETQPRVEAACGLPVMDWQTLAQAHPDAQLALGILNRDTPYEQLLEIVAEAGFAPPLMPWQLYQQFSSDLGWRFWLSASACLLEGLERVGAVAQRLADEQSRQILYRMCAFRLGLDMPYSRFLSAESHYVNTLTLPALQGADITYVDCGAYDGDSYAQLIEAPGVSCTRAFLLEPDPDNFARLVQRVARNGEGAVCLPLAAAQAYAMLSFNAGQGEACSIGTGAGESVIAAVALDQLLPDVSVDVIKLDVEGAEAQVLAGAQQLIRRSRPVLMVSLYHNPQDVWQLPELLFDYCPNYSFYIRQHAANTFEAVLYAVPRS